ncbi:MAG TPA: FTR1 family protein [Patescibacteria group bacterium]|nr:FTR1 family protein [Patescibacteria group bacterium]
MGVTGKKSSFRIVWTGIVLLGAAALVWLTLFSGAGPAPAHRHPGSLVDIVNVGILVFREGLECILVLAALTAGMTGARQRQRRPVFLGAAIGLAATLITWRIAVQVIADVSRNVSALEVQAATGLLAVIVLLTVMNWFFHKIYWTGWISLHSRKRQDLLGSAGAGGVSATRLLLGLGLLGFTSLYREGFEVVLFLQDYRLRLGGLPVLYGALAGLGLTAAVGLVTFVAHRHLPYRKMLILTGVLLGMVLLVMVGEQAQEMQLAGWLSRTNIPWLARILPPWAGAWLSVFPTVETLAAQAAAAVAVIGSYFVARKSIASRGRLTDLGGTQVSHSS